MDIHILFPVANLPISCYVLISKLTCRIVISTHIFWGHKLLHQRRSSNARGSQECNSMLWRRGDWCCTFTSYWSYTLTLSWSACWSSWFTAYRSGNYASNWSWIFATSWSGRIWTAVIMSENLIILLLNQTTINKIHKATIIIIWLFYFIKMVLEPLSKKVTEKQCYCTNFV